MFSSDIKSALYFLSGYRYLRDGNTDRRDILHDCIHIIPGTIFSTFRGDTLRDPQTPNFGLTFWITANI